MRKRRVRQIGLGGERQTLQGKSSKLSRVSHTISGKLDELPTDLDTKLLGSIRINKRLMRSHYQPDRFKSLRQFSNQFRIIERILRAHRFPHAVTGGNTAYSLNHRMPVFAPLG